MLQETRLLGDIEVVMGRRRAVQGLSLVTVNTVLPSVTVIALILGITLTVPVVGAARAVPIAAAVSVVVAVSVTSLVLAGRVFASAATRGGRTSPSGRAATTTTVPVATGLETPGCGRRSAGPLDLQDVVTANALVVHLVVSIISIATILILDEREETARCRPRSWNVATYKATIAANKCVSTC